LGILTLCQDVVVVSSIFNNFFFSLPRAPGIPRIKQDSVPGIREETILEENGIVVGQWEGEIVENKEETLPLGRGERGMTGSIE